MLIGISWSIARRARRRQGFTIVELLIVIVVIGILAAISTVAYNGTQQRTRDMSRISDLRGLQKVIEMYYIDNGSYPLPGNGSGSWTGQCTTYGAKDDYIVGLTPAYIPKLPYEKYFTTVGQQCYLYRSNGIDYSLISHMSAESVCGGDPSNICNSEAIRAFDRPINTQLTFAVYSPGGATW